MFNPSELEGEVDHSFFDSDCDDDGIRRDRGKKLESPPAHERLCATQTEKTKDDLSLRTSGRKNHLKQVNNNRSNVERKENSCQSREEERSKASNVSSVASMSDKVIISSSDSEDDYNLHSKRSGGTFMALLAKGGEIHDKDVYNQSSNESEEEAVQSSAKHSGSKRRNKQSPKKLSRNWRMRSPLPSSTKVSVDADSESSSSSSSGRSSLGSPTLPKPKRSSLSPGERRARVGTAGSLDLPTSHAEESDDTVTDVSPLSSPDISPLQSLDLNHTEAEEGSLKEQQQHESVPSSGLGNIDQAEGSDEDVDECSLSSDSQLGGKLVFHCPGGRNRKNYSFTNDEVRRIDRENQRLLRELSRLSPGPRPGSADEKKANMAGKSPLIRLSHSALNRQREQQRIERENLAFLKRLESVKPTPGLRRSEQMADYQRQVGYLGAPSLPICGSTSKKKRPTSRTASAGPRSTSSAHHSSRAVSTTTDSSSTPLPRSKKLSAARPAWC
ncbi:cilia- and flagella-associated protein 97 isoform X1 [Seriola aureovittata]|uniref:cilia- and flagella-associated protein 97 isoform X1 n=1 Tax=Seriola aureovittata TaxID=2871759 RepID=UPI0024BE4FCB|nr:cilia- and flagella-associated protein 97 isoform X1 [Seriola aureovittata]